MRDFDDPILCGINCGIASIADLVVSPDTFRFLSTPNIEDHASLRKSNHSTFQTIYAHFWIR